MINRTLQVCCFGLFLALPVFAGTVFELETREFGGPEPIFGTVQMSTEAGNARLEIISVTSEEAGGLIYRGDSNKMIILDHLQGQFIALDQAQMNAMAGKVSSAMSQMQEALAEMPPEERALAEQMMQRQMPEAAPAPSPSTINSLGSHGEIAGIACANYEVLRDGRKVRELCVSNWDDLEGGQETAAALRKVAAFFEEMRKAFSGSGGMDVFDRQQELFGHMNELDGYPVLYRDFDASGSMTRETLLTAAKQKDIAPEFFEPPPAYTVQELPQGMN
jgi:hypothetical protein